MSYISATAEIMYAPFDLRLVAIGTRIQRPAREYSNLCLLIS